MFCVAESAAESDFTGEEARALSGMWMLPLSTVDPRSIYDRQRRRALNTRQALCVELAKSSLLALEWQELARVNKDIYVLS